MRKVDGQRWARHLTLCSLPVVAATIIAGVILEGWYLGRDDELPWLVGASGIVGFVVGRWLAKKTFRARFVTVL